MAITEAFQASATIGTTEYFLAAASTTPSYQTTDGCYQLFVELNNMADGDTFRLRAYEKISSAGTARVVWEEHFGGVQNSPLWPTPTLILLHGWDFSITKIAGTDRSIAWSIRKVG